MGKSSAAAHLLWENASKFDLVICFVGSANCNPVLQSLLERYWDTRFFFSEWKPGLIDNLMVQQERLRDAKRSILIVLDDVVLTSKDQDQLACLAIRGRLTADGLCELHHAPKTGAPVTRRRVFVLTPDEG